MGRLAQLAGLAGIGALSLLGLHHATKQPTSTQMQQTAVEARTMTIHEQFDRNVRVIEAAREVIMSDFTRADFSKELYSDEVVRVTARTVIAAAKDMVDILEMPNADPALKERAYEIITYSLQPYDNQLQHRIRGREDSPLIKEIGGIQAAISNLGQAINLNSAKTTD